MSDDRPDPTTRFTKRADNYERYRPGYPNWIVDLARERLDLAAHAPVADVGSGTGLSSQPFLDAGHPVYAIEPNEAMRRRAEAKFAAHPLFHSLESRAEATGLGTGSVALWLSGQAFHWFEVDAARTEALRILDQRPRALLVWNERPDTPGGFAAEYDALVREFAIDYSSVGHQNVTDETLDRFFAGRAWTATRRDNSQTMDWDGLKGRILSASYFPSEDTTRGQEGLSALRNIFDRFAVDGWLDFPLETACYHGYLSD
jgi:SAM-dependent methyltransferase